jgi:hypothetical protein
MLVEFGSDGVFLWVYGYQEPREMKVVAHNLEEIKCRG